MATELSFEEQEIVNFIESGTAVSIDNLDSEKNRYSQIARDQIGKKKTVSMRMGRLSWMRDVLWLYRDLCF